MRALRALLLLAVLPLAGRPAHAQNAAPSTPKEVVQQFVLLDAAGAPLHAGPDDPIFKLTIDNGEPPVAPVVIIAKYEVLDASTPSDTKAPVKIQVRYMVKGTVRDNGTTASFLPGKRTAVETLTLMQDSGAWKISLENFKLTPHVDTEGYLKHLDQLLALFDPKKEAADPRYKSLLRLRTALKAQTATK